MIGLVTTAMVIAPMIAPLIGGMLDTAFGWESIFLFIAAVQRRGAALGRASRCRRRGRRRVGAGAAACCASDSRALARQRQVHGYVLCGALGSAPFFTFLGGGAACGGDA